jgi:hypothetical protein
MKKRCINNMSLTDTLMKPIFAITPDKEIDYSPVQKAFIAGITAGIPVAVLRLMGHPIKSLIPTGIGGLVSGLTIPPTVNAIIRAKQNNNSELARKALAASYFPEYDIARKIKLSLDQPIIDDSIEKQSGIVTGGVGMFGKGVWAAGKRLGKGLLPTSNKASFGTKALNVGIKAGAASGLGYGGYKAVQLSKKNRPPDYNTMLRNNIIAGKINPAELNEYELKAVREMGI